MTAQQKAPEPQGDDWKTWARRLMLFLGQTRSPLVQQTGGESAAEDGILMWDRSNGYPTVSKNGKWREIVLSDGDAVFFKASDTIAAAANTGYAITYDTPIHAHGISKDATNPERINFDEGGHYLINFTAQIDAKSSSSVDFYFWPAINGTNITGSTMKNTLKNNGATLVVSRSALFEISANDYLEVKWAVSDTNGQLTAFAATAFCPSAPSTTLTITRVHA